MKQIRFTKTIGQSIPDTDNCYTYANKGQLGWLTTIHENGKQLCCTDTNPNQFVILPDEYELVEFVRVSE